MKNREAKTSDFVCWLDYADWKAADTVRKAQAKIKREAKKCGKSVDALIKAKRRANNRAILQDICGGDKSLFFEAFVK